MTEAVWTKVEIDCYMPISTTTTYFVRIADRAAAARIALKYHDGYFAVGDSRESEYLNMIRARRHREPDTLDRGIQLDEYGNELNAKTTEGSSAEAADTSAA